MKKKVRPPHSEKTTRGKRGDAAFPIVGIGASAGGLEAFTQLLADLPHDTGMGFVLVQHLDPEHESALTQILSRATALPVTEVTNNLAVEPNHVYVYVIPRDTNLSIAEGILKLEPRPRTRTPHRPIDSFFESLAQDRQERAIGVVLSGTATDGTLGLEAIKAEGGITFAQDGSAKHDSMPRSAVAAGCVDLVLSPAGIAQELGQIAKHPYGAGQPLELPSRPDEDRAEATRHEDDDTPLPSGGRGSPRTGARRSRDEARDGGGQGGKGPESRSANRATEGYKKILLLLRNHSGVDFTLYKSSTIQRRITRRLVLSKQNALADYAAFLRGNTTELDALYSDVLISVTSFFRNPEAFEVLQREVLPKLLKQRGEEPLRCWVLGCSTGQEAYSIAMAFVEVAEKSTRARPLQIFATDLNEALLDKARHGLYAKSLAADLSPQRLRRFFVEEGGGYRISKALRDMVVFARQNLIGDPPFSRMDLVSCRNLLIYLEPSLQQRALPTFHYALKPGGFLLLGASESIGGFTDLFESVDKKHKVYAKKAAPTPGFHLSSRKTRRQPRQSRPPAASSNAPARPALPEGLRTELNAQREADRITVNQFAPPGVLVNADLQILQFRGPTAPYLAPPAGKASFDVLKMAREGLMLPLRAAINQARKQNKTARKDNVRIKQNGKTRAVSIEVIPLKNLRERGFLIMFSETQDSVRRGRVRAMEQTARAPTSARLESKRNAGLETELAETREYLQSIQEQHEAANEELQAANEEVQSANEELQSVNEELETSKEELESANEELITVNDEMSNRNVELNRLNNDLVNLQSSTKLAVMLVARDLTIRRFSPQAEKQFDLQAGDVGQPINHNRHNLVVVSEGEAEGPLDLEALSAEVIASVREQECTVRSRAGRWYSLRVRPYMTLDNKVDGAVLVLLDIEALKRSEQVIADARDYAESMIATVREPLVVLDTELHVESANAAFFRTFRITPAETLGRFIYDLGNRQWDISRLRELLGEILTQHTTIEEFEVEHAFEHLGQRSMLLNARRMNDPQRGAQRILLAIEDITERKQGEERIRKSEAIARQSQQEIRTIYEAAPVGMCFVDRDLRYVQINDALAEMSGLPAADHIGRTVREVVPELADRLEPAFVRILETGEPVVDIEVTGETRAQPGVKRTWLGSWHPHRDADGQIVGVNVFALEITDRKRAEDGVLKSEERYRSLVQAITSVVWTTNSMGRFVTPQPSWSEYTGQPWEEARDFGWADALHPDDRQRVLEQWASARAARHLYHAEGRLWNAASASYRHFEARGIPNPVSRRLGEGMGGHVHRCGGSVASRCGTETLPLAVRVCTGSVSGARPRALRDRGRERCVFAGDDD